MAVWRILSVMAALLALAQPALAQTYSLAEKLQEGDCFRFHLEMRLTGEIRVTKDGKLVSIPLTASATHEFPERVLSVAAGGLPERTARAYETARAIITVGADRSERTLRPDRCLMVAQWLKDHPLTYSPAGPLTRDELDLTDHLDTLHLAGLLPGKAVAVGETWKIANGVAQALCNFEGLTSHDLTGKLEEVKEKMARFSITGTANGISLGAMVKLTITARGSFDLGQSRLVALEWQQKDERDQGPVSPALTVQTTTTLTRAVIEEPKSLDDVALVSVPEGDDPGEMYTNLYFRDPRGRYEVVYDRRWHTTALTDSHLVMRLMERGDFVAQVTLTPWTRAEPGKHMSGEEFQEEMSATPGWEPEQVLQAGEVPLDGGRWCYRVSALGQLDELKVMQNCYLVAGPQGDQVVISFVMKQAQADKLGTRDLSLVGSLDFPSSREEEKPKQP